MLATWLAILTLLRPDAPAPEHAIYISVIEVRHLAGANTATMQVKMFTDDLHIAVSNALGDSFRTEMYAMCDALPQVTVYLRDHLKVHINSEAVALETPTCTLEGEAHHLEFILSCPAYWETMDIAADLFMEIYPTQAQMVHVNDNGDNYTLRLTKRKPSKSITFRR